MGNDRDNILNTVDSTYLRSSNTTGIYMIHLINFLSNTIWIQTCYVPWCVKCNVLFREINFSNNLRRDKFLIFTSKTKSKYNWKQKVICIFFCKAPDILEDPNNRRHPLDKWSKTHIRRPPPLIKSSFLQIISGVY